MIRVGQRVKFDPFQYATGYGSADFKGGVVVGTIVYVNWEHGWFSVEYGERQRTSFMFQDIGEDVQVV